MQISNKNNIEKVLIIIVLSIVVIFLIIKILTVNRKIEESIVKVQNEVEVEETLETFLKGGYQIGVISLNIDQACSNNGRGDSCPRNAMSLKDAIRDSLAEGKKWDIVGLQEMKESRPEKQRSDKDTEDFIQIMRELGQGNYQCEKQRVFSNDFFSVMCSKYPIVPNSYKEHVIYGAGGSQARVIQCMQVELPAGKIIFCNVHPRAYLDSGGGPMVDQFRDAEKFIFNDVIEGYVPENILLESREKYKSSLRARIILTGDTNIDNHRIKGKFISACLGKWLGQNVPPGEGCGIDQVMYVDMAYPEFLHQTPFTMQYLTSEGGYKDSARPWPTDHDGPIVSVISTKELSIPIKYELELVSTPTSVPTSTPIITPTLTPTLIVTLTPVLSPTLTSTPIPSSEVTPEDKLLIDLNEDNEVDITDFALFVEYYRVGSVKIDYDKDGKSIRDIEDFVYFVEKYKSDKNGN